MQIKFIYFKGETDTYGITRQGELLTVKSAKNGSLLFLVKELGAQPKSFKSTRMGKVSTVTEDLVTCAEPYYVDNDEYTMADARYDIEYLDERITALEDLTIEPRKKSR